MAVFPVGLLQLARGLIPSPSPAWSEAAKLATHSIFDHEEAISIERAKKGLGATFRRTAHSLRGLRLNKTKDGSFVCGQ
jgi:hypothetical protein